MDSTGYLLDRRHVTEKNKKRQFLAVIPHLEYLEFHKFEKIGHAFKDLSDIHIKASVIILYEMTKLSREHLRVTKRKALLKMLARYWEVS